MPPPISPPHAAPQVGGEVTENQEIGAYYFREYAPEWEGPRPIHTGAQVGPEGGWATLEEARAAVAALAPGSGRGRPSSVAILRAGPRFTARFLLDEEGRDLRSWHKPYRFEPKDPRWVDTLDGPSMTPAP